jgi:tetratricopeptide (TPR) repeat protein
MMRNQNSSVSRSVLHALSVSAFIVLTMSDAALGLMARKPIVDARTKEGQFFQLLELEDDGAKRIELIEQFAGMFPKHPAAIWAWEQVLEAQRLAGEHDKVILTAEKLLALNPDNIDAAYYAWKAAEGEGNRAEAGKWLQRLNEMSPRVISSARPADPEDAADWDARVHLAKQFVASKEGGLYAKALAEKDPVKRIVVLDRLAKENSGAASQADIDFLYYLAYRQSGNTNKAVESGLRVVAVSASREDVLLFLADHYFQRRESAKCISYCQRIVEVMRTKAKPAGLRDADWQNQKSVCNGSAYYMMGFLQMEAGQYASADAHFRAALGFTSGDRLTAIILNSLGYVNLRLERYGDALSFYKRCMVIKGPYQLQAAQNVDTLLLQHPEVAKY